MTPSSSRKILGSLSGLALVAGAGVTALPLLSVPAFAAEDTCPPAGGMPGVDNSGPSFVDANVSVFTGGDFTATGAAAEGEGLFVVHGEAEFDRQSGGSLFNIGTVGVGSGISPSGGEVMVRVGESMTIVDPTRVEVGAGISGGGAVDVGSDQTGQLETNGAPVDTGLGKTAALGPFADFGETLEAGSASLAALDVTGDAARSGNQVTFTGDDSSDPQVFSISAADLDGASEFYFSGIAEDAAVLVNVVGAGSVSVTTNYVSLNGERVDGLASGEFGNAASSIMWNMPEVNDIALEGGGQFMGSIAAPVASATITSSANGRVLVGGDMTMDGSGNEVHAYPWIGGHGFECLPEDSDDDDDDQAGGDADGTDTEADADVEGTDTEADADVDGTDIEADADIDGSDSDSDADVDASAADSDAKATGADAAVDGSGADANAEGSGSESDAEADGAETEADANIDGADDESGADANGAAADSDAKATGADAAAGAGGAASDSENAAADADASGLPRTGIDSAAPIVIGGLLLGLGAVLILAARRSRRV